MNLYIDNVSALHFLSMVETSLDDVSSPCSKRSPHDAVKSIADLHGIDARTPKALPEPLHVMVDSPNARTSARSLTCHVRTTELPAGSFRRIEHNVFVASPELSFYEMATKLSFPKLVEYGYLLCGTYTVNPNAASKNDRKPLSTKRKLRSFALRMSDTRGRTTALKAIDLVAEHSASPRETKMAILLSFPTRLGGYGIAQPIMNYRVNFADAEREMFGKPYVVLDLYWPDFHFGIEYDGMENHSEPHDVSRDRRKSSDLQYCGIEIIRVDKSQLADPFQVYVLARKVAHALKQRIRKPSIQQWHRRQQLFEAVMRQRNAEPGYKIQLASDGSL